MFRRKQKIVPTNEFQKHEEAQKMLADQARDLMYKSYKKYKGKQEALKVMREFPTDKDILKVFPEGVDYYNIIENEPRIQAERRAKKMAKDIADSKIHYQKVAQQLARDRPYNYRKRMKEAKNRGFIEDAFLKAEEDVNMRMEANNPQWDEMEWYFH